MNTNIKLKKAKAYRLNQEKLRNKALSKGVNLIAPETIFLSDDTIFGKNVTIEPYVVIGQKVKIGNNTCIKSFTHIEGTLNKTKISDNVFVNVSNSALVAPVKLEKNSVIGAGSVITKNVKNTLAITRSSQMEVKNYKEKKKK